MIDKARALTPRLACVAALAEGATRLIDVGCDHGYLAIALAQRGVAHIFASDLRPGPLQRARNNIAAYGLQARIAPVLCAGLDAFSAHDADTIAICGMGGEVMAGILQAAPWTALGNHHLVLQPMGRAEHLRAFLLQSGYRIEREVLAREGERLYCILSVRGGAEPQHEVGHCLFSDAMRDDPLFLEYIVSLHKKHLRILRGKQRAGQDTTQEQQIIAMLEEEAHATR